MHTNMIVQNANVRNTTWCKTLHYLGMFNWQVLPAVYLCAEDDFTWSEEDLRQIQEWREKGKEDGRLLEDSRKTVREG